MSQSDNSEARLRTRNFNRHHDRDGTAGSPSLQSGDLSRDSIADDSLKISLQSRNRVAQCQSGAPQLALRSVEPPRFSQNLDSKAMPVDEPQRHAD